MAVEAPNFGACWQVVRCHLVVRTAQNCCLGLDSAVGWS